MRKPGQRGSILFYCSLIATFVVWTSPSAAEIPGINGHMTDPQHRLSDADKKSIEDKLSALQEETHVDLAGWISDAPEDQANALGKEAYRRWGIGKAWDNGIFFMIPVTGRAHLIVEPARPELTAAEQARVLAADRPDAPLSTRLNALADAAGTLVRAKVFHARPRGAKDAPRAMLYGLAALGVALAAALGSRRTRRRVSAAV